MTTEHTGVAVAATRRESNLPEVSLVSSPREITEYAYQPLRNDAYAVTLPDYNVNSPITEADPPLPASK